MPMIFPGMDPYLEDPVIWTGFHTTMLVYLRDALRPLIRPRYIADVGVRVIVEGPDRDITPDVSLLRSPRWPIGVGTALAEIDTPVEVQVPEMEIRQPYINIIDSETQQRVVTAIEVLSPTNKYAGPGRDAYIQKQREIRHSQTHLVEIDLLRYGPHVLAVPEWISRSRFIYDYLVCVNRAESSRGKFQLYPCSLRRRLPPIRIPLDNNDPDVLLDLQSVVEKTYESGDYEERLRYNAPCVPPLTVDDQAWADERIRQARQTGAESP